MKRLKIIGLLGICSAGLMAFAVSASATSITSPTNASYTGNIHATSEGHLIQHTDVVGTIECPSTFEAKVETHGSMKTVGGKITSLSFGPCTNSWHVTVVTPGELKIHWTGNHEGTVAWTGGTWTTTRFGITCNYVTNETDIGRLTDSHTAGDISVPVTETKEDTATLHIEAKIPIHSGSSSFCGTSTTEWTGSYIVNTPDRLFIDKE